MKTEPLEPLKPVEAAIPVTTAATSQEKVVELIPSVMQMKNILVPLDFSEMSLKSLQYAVPFAKQFGAKLTLVHVVEAPSHAADSSFPALVSRDKLAAVEKQIEDMIPPELSVDTAVRQSVPIDGILEVANEIQADLIITTTHGYTGLAQLFKGATVSNIVNRSPCPVLVVRESEHGFV
jgi:universal stress protein A